MTQFLLANLALGLSGGIACVAVVGALVRLGVSGLLDDVIDLVF